MFDPLIDRKNRYVPGSRETAMLDEPLQIHQHPVVAVGTGVIPVH